MKRLMRFSLAGCAGLAAAGAILSACGGNESASAEISAYKAEIRRTSYGIPHIKADDDGSLGYGIGYAYAEDNVCLLANEVLTVNGERSKYFGAEGTTSDLPMLRMDNLTADFFFRLMNDDAAVTAAWQAQPAEVQALVRGYAAGVNAYLEKTGTANLPQACRNGSWVRAIDERDVMKLMRRIAVANSSAGFMEGLVGAQPPGDGKTARAPAHAYTGLPKRHTASNAVALGKEATDNGKGMLLGQPHLPWGDTFRFYQLHLTIPGKLDVMGATLPGLPIVGIGFTENLAWSHTTDTSAHYTLYALELDRDDPTRYVVDGKPHAMTRKTIHVEARGADGKLTTQSRDFYHTRFGPVLVFPEAGLQWTDTTAYAIRDANADNHRAIAQWYAMNRASSLEELKAANTRIVGNPWNNTIAADKDGNTLYLNVSPIPNLSEAKLAECVPEPYRPLAAAGMFVLAGHTSRCDWAHDPAAPQAGIFAGDKLPALSRNDYVHNSNDSAWLTHPAAPLAGFSPVISMDGGPQGMRTRLGLLQLQTALAADGQGQRRISQQALQDMALGNNVHLAQLVMDDVLELCRAPGSATTGDGATVDLTAACARLASWDRSANSDANMGYLYFAGMMGRVIGNDAVWAVPFDPADPLNTPRGLKHRDPAVAAVLRRALASSVHDANRLGWSPDARLGDIQVTRRAGKIIPVHGGREELGIYNAMISTPGSDGLLDVVAGTTYVQSVAFTGSGPHALALLAYSQSANPGSAHHADQTERFSRKQWITLPFSETQITSDPQFRTRTVGSATLGNSAR